MLIVVIAQIILGITCILIRNSMTRMERRLKNIVELIHNDNEELNTAIRRGKSLDKIEAPYYTLQLQDSLLRLSAML